MVGIFFMQFVRLKGSSIVIECTIILSRFLNDVDFKKQILFTESTGICKAV